MHSFRMYDSKHLVDFLYRVNEVIGNLTPEKYIEYTVGTERSMHSRENDSYIAALVEDFYPLQKDAMELCATTLKLIHDQNAFKNFLKDRTNAFLNHEFNKQIQPVRYKRRISRIELRNENSFIVKARIKIKNRVEFQEESSFVYPYDRCIFIDNPFIIDKLKTDKDRPYPYLYREFDEDEDEFSSIISSEDIEDHDSILMELLTETENKNFFSDVELQQKYNNVFNKINDIVPGEFSKNSEGYFYINEGAQLSVKNMATGSKLFFIIKKLLLSGLIDGKTMLILDEPESHLHPEWINKFAEILVFLVENINAGVLLTTHSPNLMLALNVYANKMNITDRAHFYLAENTEEGYFSKIKCIDDNIGEGYAHLSLPLIDMSLEQQEISGE